jgi:hypothetical protein
MNYLLRAHRFAILLLVACGTFAGCESTDNGSRAPTNVYYGTGFSDPWYYGGSYDDSDVIVVPPRNLDDRPHPEQPIARPSSSGPRPLAQPSIPSMPRGGGGGGGGGRRR